MTWSTRGTIRIRRRGQRLEAWAPAKLNLFLEVLAKRPDGYHELETLMVPVTLFDTLELEEDPTGRIEFSSQVVPGLQAAGTSTAVLPEGAENLVVRAIRLLRQRSGTSSGAVVRLTKRIPIAAGLAGGSSDAAAALAAARRLWRLPRSDALLHELAAELGSDVPFFLGGGSAVCRGRGERIEPASSGAPLHVVIVSPPAGLATAEVFRHCRPAEAAHRVVPLAQALARGDVVEVGRRLFNRLQAPAEQLSGWVGRLRNEFDRLDLPGHQMSGSGTSYFGLCRHAAQARRVAGWLRARGIGKVYAAQTAAGCW